MQLFLTFAVMIACCLSASTLFDKEPDAPDHSESIDKIPVR